MNDKQLINQIIFPDDQDLFIAHRHDAVTNHGEKSIYFRIITKEGDVKHIEHVCQPVYDINGAFIGTRGTNIDITDKINFEELKVNAIYEAADAERSRIAMEIHDGLQQTLIAGKMGFESVRKEIAALPANYQQRYLYALELLDQGIKEARTIAHNIIPKQIKEYGFVATAEHMLHQLDENLTIKFVHENQRFTDVNIDVNLFRILQEAVNNSIKHANAKNLYVSLKSDGRSSTLIIQDDGVGFDGFKKGDGGIGLKIMKNRASAIGAKLIVDSKENEGTTIQLLIDHSQVVM
jgi:two-component system sensor histidine kinase DegS